MWKLVLGGAAFAALTIGSAAAADKAVRPMRQAPQAVFGQPFPWFAEPARPSMRARARKARAARSVRTPAVDPCIVGQPKKQYWATSLSRAVDRGLLQGLQDAVARGETGWLDVNPRSSVPAMAPGTNLILYHVGGNCYTGSDCNRFPSSKPTGDRWGNEEREIDLNDPQVRRVVVEDLVNLMRQADALAPTGATVGVHLDNVHNLDADGLARVFNDYLRAVDEAKQQGLISSARTVGYIAKNNPDAFRKVLDRKLLKAAPLYQINENATLSQAGKLDDVSRAAQDIGRRYGIPVFLKTFGTDVAYTIQKDSQDVDVTVSQEMTQQMAQLPNIAGAAWSPDEAQYQPTLFAQGSPVRTRSGSCEKVAASDRSKPATRIATRVSRPRL